MHRPACLLLIQGYFDTLRMELAAKNISIISVCPGPVDTPFLRNLFTEKLATVSAPSQTREGGNRVTVERCANLIAATMANNLKEVWISKQPILLFVYTTQFFPILAKWLVSWWKGFRKLCWFFFQAGKQTWS